MRTRIESPITSCIDRLSVKYNIPVQDFFSWKNKILQLVDRRIQVLKSSIIPCATKPILQDDEVQSALSTLHDKFVIAPNDKATNNVAIICKRFYVQKLLNEVGIPGSLVIVLPLISCLNVVQTIS